MRDGYYIAAQSAIVMFDLQSSVSFSNVQNWLRDVARVCDNIPTVVVAHKCDINSSALSSSTSPSQLLDRIKKQHPTIECVIVSSKSNYNFESPFLHLARALTNDTTLMFVEEPALCPPASLHLFVFVFVLIYFLKIK